LFVYLLLLGNLEQIFTVISSEVGTRATYAYIHIVPKVLQMSRVRILTTKFITVREVHFSFTG